MSVLAEKRGFMVDEWRMKDIKLGCSLDLMRGRMVGEVWWCR